MRKTKDTCSSRRVDVIAFFQRRIRCHRITKDEDQHGRYDIGPGDLPVSVQFNTQHELNVTHESVETVDPTNANSFNSGHQENDETTAKVIDDIQYDQTTLKHSKRK